MRCYCTWNGCIRCREDNGTGNDSESSADGMDAFLSSRPDARAMINATTDDATTEDEAVPTPSRKGRKACFVVDQERKSTLRPKEVAFIKSQFGR